MKGCRGRWRKEEGEGAAYGGQIFAGLDGTPQEVWPAVGPKTVRHSVLNLEAGGVDHPVADVHVHLWFPDVSFKPD